jgi:hypothetical protein
MQKSFKKLKTIVNAYTEALPEAEKWFQERLKICQTCEFNSDNVPEEKKDMIFKLKAKTIGKSVCSKNRWCTACGCCIDEKASRKEVACGLTEIGQAPKWPKLSFEDKKDNRINIIVSGEGEDSYVIEEILGDIYLDFGTVIKDVIDFKFRVFHPKSYLFVTTKVSCGCTVAEVTSIDENHIEVSGRVSTVGFSTSTATVKGIQIDFDKGTTTVKLKIAKQ